MSYPRGSTATLPAEYTDGTGSFVDPTSPLVDILDPLGATVVNDAAPTRDSLGHYHYDYAIPADALLGTWTARWSGVIGDGVETGDDEFEVTGGITAALATFDEVQLLMPGVALDAARVALLLAIASDTIRDETRQTLSLVEDDELEVRGVFGREWWLPERPVLAVASITLDDQDVPTTAYRASRDGRVTFYPSGWSTTVNGPDAMLSGYWGGDERTLRIVYDHGYDPLPAGIKGVCIDLVRGAIVAPDAGIIRQESLGSYNVSYDTQAARMLTDDHRRILRRYSRRNATVLVGP